jgi:hypothetical protein
MTEPRKPYRTDRPIPTEWCEQNIGGMGWLGYSPCNSPAAPGWETVFEVPICESCLAELGIK